MKLLQWSIWILSHPSAPLLVAGLVIFLLFESFQDILPSYESRIDNSCIVNKRREASIPKFSFGSFTVILPARSPKPSPSLDVTIDRYRLVGTFFSYTDASDREPQPRAIIDDVSAGRQRIVAVGTSIGPYTVAEISRNQILLKDANAEIHALGLTFYRSASSSKRHYAGGGGQIPGPTETAYSSNTFGYVVGSNRWIINRSALLDYYSELLEDPERLAAIYLSLEPDYNSEGHIAGYSLDIQGEKSFFESVGLQQGDVIRCVNSMRMTSQSRAEYFLHEFMKNRVSAIVLDIERNREPRKLIYLIR